jgi:hypothetical protein
MATAWTLLASEVCADALRHLGVLGEGEAASGDQQQSALRGLDIVLKELPLAGYVWPKLSGEVALTWAGIQALTLPTDYYGYPTAWKTVSGQKSPLTQIPHSNWVQMPDRTAAGTVTHFYISPAGTFNVWPVPTTDPVVTLQYQKIVNDASLAVTPDVLQAWKGALSYGVANEIALMSGAPQAVRVEIAQRWGAKKALALANSVSYEPISFGVQE